MLTFELKSPSTVLQWQSPHQGWSCVCVLSHHAYLQQVTGVHSVEYIHLRDALINEEGAVI